MKKITIESRSTTSGKRQDTHNQNELQGLVVAVRSKQTRIALACICVLVVGAAITSLVVLLKDNSGRFSLSIWLPTIVLMCRCVSTVTAGDHDHAISVQSFAHNTSSFYPLEVSV
jgi:hypothetical protein